MNTLKQYIRQLLVNALRRFSTYRTAFNLPEGTICFDKLDKEPVVYCCSDEPAERKLPLTIGSVHKSFKAKSKSASWKVFVVRAKNWRVWGNQGAVLSNNDLLFADVSREFDDNGHSIFKQFKIIKPAFHKGKIAVLAASGSQVYYHWMFDILPRINILQKSGIFDTINKFIINYQAAPFQTETITRAGLALENIIISDKHWDFHLQAEELVVPSLVSPNDIPSKAACNYLRTLFANELKVPGGRKNIYVQRLGGRRVLNEEQLLPMLKCLAFEIINAEHYTVAEQASIFAGADLIIGPHGAGLTNIVFCKPGAVVIDLFAPEWVNPCYWIIAEHLNLRYGYLIGEYVDDKKENPKGADILVSIEKLTKLISLFDAGQALIVASAAKRTSGTAA